MLCAPIKLTNRTLRPGELDANKYKSKLLNEKLYLKSNYYHSYTFRWDRSKKFIGTPTNTNYSLAVNNISLPENVPAFNTGSSLQKWSNKRPRLKSSNNAYPRKEISSNDDTTSEETFNVATLIQRFSQEVEAEQNDDKIQQELLKVEEEEIDPDILRLISISQSSSEQDEDHSRSQKKKHKKKEKKTKTIRFSLSKPPSPQTVQVIRVDVTSNYSWEEENADSNCKEQSKDCSKGCGKRIKSGLAARKGTLKKQFSIHDDDVDLLCKKLSLI
ncbi:uncharacterized protein [Onthophagus taurus]|uniref:uncharacterized protein n=1 Tax=Onthophagus taurus TaxID=166361 RepID=UPI0039BE7F3C